MTTYWLLRRTGVSNTSTQTPRVLSNPASPLNHGNGGGATSPNLGRRRHGSSSSKLRRGSVGRLNNRSCHHLMSGNSSSRGASLRKLRPKTSEGVLLDLISDLPASAQKSPPPQLQPQAQSQDEGEKSKSIFRIESDETFY